MYFTVDNKLDNTAHCRKLRELTQSYNELKKENEALKAHIESSAYDLLEAFVSAVKEDLRNMNYSAGVAKKYMLTRHAESDANELLHEFVPCLLDDVLDDLIAYCEDNGDE